MSKNNAEAILKDLVSRIHDNDVFSHQHLSKVDLAITLIVTTEHLPSRLTSAEEEGKSSFIHVNTIYHQGDEETIKEDQEAILYSSNYKENLNVDGWLSQLQNFYKNIDTFALEEEFNFPMPASPSRFTHFVARFIYHNFKPSICAFQLRDLA